MEHFAVTVSFTDIKSLLVVCYVMIVAATIAVIIYDRRDPVKALAWIMVITLIPVAGIILYILFGRNHRKEKLFNRKELVDLKQISTLCGDQLRDLLDPDRERSRLVNANRNIITLLLNNNKSLLTMRNRVKILNDGRSTYEELFGAIRSARSSIHLEYYIFEWDEIGQRLAELLVEKAKEGVAVRLIYDDVGSWSLKYRQVRRLRRQGLDVRCFMPVVFPWLTSKINYRNHRKIAVIDGRVAFTGGINIAKRYLAGTKMGPWRDTHLRIEGEAVNMLQAVFVTDWYFVSGRQLLTDNVYIPKTRIRNVCPVQIASSGPDSDWASIMQAYFAAINKARRSIYVTTPYFLPNQAILTALKVASLSGIDVRIILPSKSDSRIVYWATRSYISELLDAGIKIYFYRDGFNHSKLMIVDGAFCSVGTANLDIRSFEDNFEVSAVIYDPRIASRLTEYYMKDLEKSILITPGMWSERSNLHAAYESLSRLLSPLL